MKAEFLSPDRKPWTRESSLHRFQASATSFNLRAANITNIDQNHLKRSVAEATIEHIESRLTKDTILGIGTGSTVNFCCVATGQIKNDDGSVLMLSRGDEISTVWNNKHYREIRRQMIEGERVEGCKPCYDLEDLGIPSYRQNYITDWMGFHRNAEQIKDIVAKSIDNDYVVDEAPQYLDFRLGTLCNLRCRMCQSQNSSAIYKELQDEELYTQEAVSYTHLTLPTNREV